MKYSCSELIAASISDQKAENILVMVNYCVILPTEMGMRLDGAPRIEYFLMETNCSLYFN
jgi:hypothetical protein